MVLWLVTDVDTEFEYLCQNRKYTGDLGLTKGVPELIDFFEKHEINATFHMQEQKDEEKSILMKYPRVYELIEKHKHEIGLHSHLLKEDYSSRRNEISAGLERLRSNGYTIETFKAGWYFTNENTIRVLAEENIKYDCSPFKNHVVGPMRWYDIPDSPYHPARENIHVEGDSPVLIVPITSMRLGLTIHKNNKVEENMMREGITALANLSEKMGEPVILFFTLHSWKPITINGMGFRTWEKQRRESFIETAKSFGAESLTVGEAGRRWEKGGYKPYYLDIPDFIGKYRSPFNPARYIWLVNHIFSRIYGIKYKLTHRL